MKKKSINEITFTRILHILFHRSLSKVWNIGSVRYYAGKKAQGKPLPSIHKEDDPLQMGGDFTFRLVLMSSIYLYSLFSDAQTNHLLCPIQVKHQLIDLQSQKFYQ